MTSNPIPSPFEFTNLDDKEFIEAVEALQKKFGYRQLLVVYSKMDDSDVEMWSATSNVVSEEMIEYLEDEAIPFIRECLDDEG